MTKVMIVKASLDTFWYHHHIGSIFEVKEDKISDNLWEAKILGYIKADDCIQVGDDVQRFEPIYIDEFFTNGTYMCRECGRIVEDTMVGSLYFNPAAFFDLEDMICYACSMIKRTREVTEGIGRFGKAVNKAKSSFDVIIGGLNNAISIDQDYHTIIGGDSNDDNGA